MGKSEQESLAQDLPHDGDQGEDDASPWIILGRAAGGSILFTLPMLMTMEMWWLGFYMDPLKLALMVVLTFPLLCGLAYYSGFELRLSLRGVIVDAFVAYAVGMITATTLLVVFAIIKLDMSLIEIVGKITLQTIPASMGAVLAASQMGGDQEKTNDEKENDELKKDPSYGGELFLMICGALFFAFNVAPTEEMIAIAYGMSAWHAFFLVLISLAVMHAFVYKVEFHGQEIHPEGYSWWAVFSRFTVAGYALALLVSLYCLWSFGRLVDENSAIAVSQMIVLGFPAAVGAAAARLIL